MSQMPLINMFWHGERLPALHQMCIASFVQQGHPVDLYSYAPSLEGLPDGVVLKDASSILSSESIFRESEGSYALFADQFRYEMLHQIGGWWADCDVYCLRPFDFDAEYVFGLESPGKINNAVIKAPRGGPLTQQLVEDAKQLAVHRDWDRAVRVFHDAVTSQGLDHAALPQHVFYPVPYTEWASVFSPGGLNLPPNSHAVHMWGEMIRRQGPDFSPPFATDSPAASLWQQMLVHTTPIGERVPSFTLYVLSYNCPRQFEYWINHCESVHKFAAHKVLIDNTNQDHLSQEYERLCAQHGFEHIKLNNEGIMGGRIVAADHFVNQAHTDLCIYFEDDFITNTPTSELCRSGFPMYVDGWLESALRLALHEDLDYLKLSFSEVFFNNDVQVSWFNVSDTDKARLFPGATQPPATKFSEEKAACELEYYLGEIFWCTWPQIMSKKGCRSLLRPDFKDRRSMYVMGELYKETLAGDFKPAVLKSSLVTHHREHDYNRETRML